MFDYKQEVCLEDCKKKAHDLKIMLKDLKESLNRFDDFVSDIYHDITCTLIDNDDEKNQMAEDLSK